MLKKAAILGCMLAFLFQAVLFNAFLYGFILSVKIAENNDHEGIQHIALSQKQYEKLQWLNEDEFSFGNYLIDVKEVKTQGDYLLLSYKVDLKEKDFLEKLIDHVKHSKNKKASFVSIEYKITESLRVLSPANTENTSYKILPVTMPPGAGLDKTVPPPKA
jgi:hypothetical protein